MFEKFFRKRILAAVSSVMIAMMSIPSVMSSADLKGDANSDGLLNVRDCAYIAQSLACGRTLPSSADYNSDGKANIRDAAAIASALTGGGSTSSSTPSTASSYAVEILTLVNKERAKVGASPLTLNMTLNRMADARAVEIVTNFSHTRPNNTSCFTIFDTYGLNYSYAGENIAAGSSTPAQTVDLWVNSEGHYKNMISTNFTEMGVGYYYDANSPYHHHWVQIFRAP